MCISCWQETIEDYSDNTLYTIAASPITIELAQSIEMFHREPYGSPTWHGGPMHVQLDDWNTDCTFKQSSIDRCIENWTVGNYKDDARAAAYRNDPDGVVADMMQRWNSADQLTRAVALATWEDWLTPSVLAELRATTSNRDA